MTTNSYCSTFRRASEDITTVFQGACMWQEGLSDEVKKYGKENADKATVYVPAVDADIRKGDYIFKGLIYDAPDDKELYKALVVDSVDVNSFGSPDMQHLKIGAK